jgi:hypothetical protein
LEVFMVADTTPTNGHGQIFHNRQTNPNGGEGEWTGWHTLDANNTSGWSAIVGPAVVRNADGLLDLFVMSADRGIYTESWWSDYSNSTAVGHYRQTEDDKWSGPELRIYIETCIEVEDDPAYQCESKLPVKLIPSLNSNDRIELFANVGELETKRRGLPGLTYIPASLWHSWQGDGHSKNWWTGSFPMPPIVADHGETEYESQAAQPLVALDHDGRLGLYMWGATDHDVWVRKQDPNVQGGWSSWFSIGKSKEWRRPIIVAGQNNILTVFASSMTSNSVWYLAQHLNDDEATVWSDDWQTVDDVGDTSGADLLHAITNQDGRIELFASGPGNVGFRHKYQDASGKWF